MSNVDCNGFMAHSRLLPTFFVIGPPRTGTSWVHDVLAPHTSLPDNVKETRFFDLHFRRGFSWYLRYFSDAQTASKPRGEVAPTYFASARARQRIAESCPHAKVVCIFRHPLERVISLYRLKYAYGMVRCSFEDAVLFDPEFLESGKYATHLKAWYAAMDPKQILVTFYDQLRDQPQVFVDTVADFIGIPRFSLGESPNLVVHASEFYTQPRNVLWTRLAVAVADRLKTLHLDGVARQLQKSVLRKYFLASGRAFTRPSPTIARAVLELFRPQVEGLEAMLNVDLSAWKPKDSDFESLPPSRDEPLALFSMSAAGSTTW